MIMGLVNSFEITKQRFQRSYMWEFLPAGFGFLYGDFLGQYCQEIRFGDYNMSELIKLRYNGYQRGYAGYVDINTFTVKFAKPVPDFIYMFLNSWKRMIIDKQGFHYPKSNYARTCFVNMLDTSGIMVSSFKLMGCFPTIYPMHEMSYRSEDIVTFDVTFNVDKIDENSSVSVIEDSGINKLL